MSEIKISEEELAESILSSVASLKEEVLRISKSLDRIEKQVFLVFPQKKPAPKSKKSPKPTISEQKAMEIFNFIVENLQRDGDLGFTKFLESLSDNDVIEISIQIGGKNKPKTRMAASEYIRRKAQERIELSFTSLTQTT
jgi:hypothetical protein